MVPKPREQVGRPTPSPSGAGLLRLVTAEPRAAALIVPCTELPNGRIVLGETEVELFGCGSLCCCALGNTGRLVVPLPRSPRDRLNVRSWHCHSGWACAGLPSAAADQRVAGSENPASNSTLPPTAPQPLPFLRSLQKSWCSVVGNQAGRYGSAPASLPWHLLFSFSHLGCPPQTPPFHHPPSFPSASAPGKTPSTSLLGSRLGDHPGQSAEMRLPTSKPFFRHS